MHNINNEYMSTYLKPTFTDDIITFKPNNDIVRGYFNLTTSDSSFFIKWLIEDYSYVNIGDDIFEISEYKQFSHSTNLIQLQCKNKVKSSYSGILVHNIKQDIADIIKLNKDSLLCTIYKNELSIMEDRFKYQFNVNKDDFTKKTIINCKFLEEILTTTFYTSLGIRIASYLKLNFEWVEDKCYILLSYDKKEIKLNKKISFLMLFDDDSVISLKPETNPSNDVCRLRL